MTRLILAATLLATAACTTVERPAEMAAPAAALMRWADLTARPRPTGKIEIAYGSDPYQRVDLWLPAGAGPHPTVLMVHGGCWTTDIADRTLMDWAAADLRSAGYAVWNIDYRGQDRAGGGYPGTFADVAAAADALRDHAAQYSLDTRRVVAIGHSAGGHLALWLAARPRLPAGSPLRSAAPLPIAHVISLGGLPDLERTAATPANGCGTEVVGKLVAGANPADRFADTSVARLLPIGVPQDHVAGLQDRIIPIELKTDFVARAQAAGDRATLHRIDRTGHVELIAPGTDSWTRTRALVAKAFGR
ncbi:MULTISPECIES: alpha/beta hydrolase family protein [unclassified Sphingomonas]|jgi:acetyl esterase/lipase|uniref:alpha/beta hydrolase family protein n=1 Tax=unclassified Sphingomonas TaxID=196159 RepID=UPI000B32435E|nr:MULTISPECIES: alpha/beta hydrolase [unclassified Sphingomonas]